MGIGQIIGCQVIALFGHQAILIHEPEAPASLLVAQTGLMQGDLNQVSYAGSGRSGA